ncbi:MAG: DEAD/DEAH box helicase, partial [Leptolyngbya sp. Prado105]|nr:DEAD/DEAH box helicase [Leptolyngbya sp. Prado105]
LIQLSGQGPQCNPFLVEIATREAVNDKIFETMVAAIEAKIPIRTGYNGKPRYFNSERQFLREARISIYRNHLQSLLEQFDDYYRYNYAKQKITVAEVLTNVCNNPFDASWFGTLSPELYEVAMVGIFNHSMLHFVPADEAFEQLQEDCKHSEIFAGEKLLLIEQLLLKGQLTAAKSILESLSASESNRSAALWGWLHTLTGEIDSALSHFTIALAAYRKAIGKRKAYFDTLPGIFFILALLKEGSATRLSEAKTYATTGRQGKHWLSSTYETLEKVIQLQQGDIAQKDWLLDLTPYRRQHGIETIINTLALYWTDHQEAKRVLSGLGTLYTQTHTAGYEWISLEVALLLSRMKPKSEYVEIAETLQRSTGIAPLLDLVKAQEPWELSLNALLNLNQTPTPSSHSGTTQRLAWSIILFGTHWSIQPKEQSLNAKGEWGKGRNIALKRLARSLDEFPYLTEQDRKVCSEIKAYSAGGYYGQQDYRFSDRAILGLIGHPFVFWEDTPGIKIEIVKGEPELIVKKGKNDRLTLELSPTPKDNQSIVLVKESPTRLKVIELTTEHRRIAEILGSRNKLEVPEQAKDQVMNAIQAISGLVTVHSDIGGGVSAEEVPADPTPNFHLFPSGSGLRVTVLVRPFATGGSYYRPGMGGETVIAEVDGKRLQTTRDLEQERKLANDTMLDCDVLMEYEQEDGEWVIEDPENCLELLLELQELGDRAIISHPEGQKFRIRREVGFDNFHLKIQQERDWFEASGELRIDQDSVLELQYLLELLGQSNSRFIRLEDGQFLALTTEFRRRLEEFRAIAEKQGKKTRFHPLAAVAIEDWVDEVGELEADQYWQRHIQKLKEVEALAPTVPSTLQADLRDYQVEGFCWMARLAHWGVGACLADGMGLGKTLQSIALILTRAMNGATLVIAPTSVCLNWIEEIERFAPTLKIVQFGSGDRQKVIDRLEPFDVLICSYGLLQQDDVSQLLSQVEWQTIVLDEAQSIKNFATKRSQAAMNLRGGFKLITTGTPIENHLGELWNLFRFINPGLLGSLEQFSERFAIPIERWDDKQARTRLRKLIQPFILRRTKTQVLQELPSRTEITLHVELTTEERLFYEALRKSAMRRLAESDAPAGQKHLQVLAEIMKLRRSCCNSRLVTPGSTLPSAKLQLFGEVLEELLDNKHKVLVFSQFVDHLKILQELLDEKAISYQYLDGSTSIPERKKRINAFQAGKGDVFLISLKAGGTGLNLTAADYVIHMDPWWNPAVEDQASDRAHRMGQQRPVTIYRLVAKDTIEDKIVDLHQHKRDLADSLLEGTEVSGKISTQDLLNLIQTG